MLLEGGFLKGKERPSGMSHYPIITISDLSWEGHEFIAAVRDKSIWNQVKQKFSTNLADLPLTVVRGVASALVKRWAMGQIDLS